MTVYLLKRFLGLVPLFFGITLVSFLVLNAAPGGPADTEGGFGSRMTVAARERLSELYGLDKPVLARYGDWAGRVLRLDFGKSFVDGQPVVSKIAEALPVTVLVNGLALCFLFPCGIFLGLCAAVRQGRLVDRGITLFSLAAWSIPSFWLALMLMSFFGVHLRLLPVTGLWSLHFEELSPALKAADLVRHLILPVLAASLAGTAAVSRFMRSSMADTLRQNYIRAARARGLGERRVLWRHALKNAWLPVITLLGLSLPSLVGGSVILETVFSLPGMGRLFYQSVFARDYPVIMGILVLGAALTLMGNLLADVLYGAADPRAKGGRP